MTTGILFSEQDRTDIARIVFLQSVKRRLERPDVLQAAKDAREALSQVDPSDWVSLLRFACWLADQTGGDA